VITLYSCTPFKSTFSTFPRWKKEILNYFDYNRYTNATTEGINNAIEHIDNMGYGYGFKFLRYKTLFHPRTHNRTVMARSSLPLGYGLENTSFIICTNGIPTRKCKAIPFS
jgi:hypothetical protein